MRRYLRRRHVEPGEMNITAFMNLMVILVPFLLITAVFSRLTVLDLNLPAAASADPDVKEELRIEITVRKNAVELGERRAGLLQRFENGARGYDLQGLSAALRQLKQRFPDKTDAAILLEPEVKYNTLVQIMDTVRVYATREGDAVTRYELFPDISIGDAPLRTAALTMDFEGR